MKAFAREYSRPESSQKDLASSWCAHKPETVETVKERVEKYLMEEDEKENMAIDEYTMSYIMGVLGDIEAMAAASEWIYKSKYTNPLLDLLDLQDSEGAIVQRILTQGQEESEDFVEWFDLLKCALKFIAQS